ncbi:3503_t:CDS:10 [Entrophospora sp. SA101]|nr:13104_t:CDS:10 [Entrophospora sp. SA101]CAJ0828388.1 11134_t:CDS:10 [Entrophospora sp. SA101]CAJ0874737.1 3503_t:CDS:10 [Entrophospora sp. SA101]
MSTTRTKDILIDESVNFEALITNKNLLKGLKVAGYDIPSPIQLKAIPPGKLGLDVISQAKSGTGKTIVFGIISLEMIDLTPTREIAIQIKEVICNIGKYIEGLTCNVFIGGIPVEEDFPKLKKCHIAIGSPGRIDLLLRNQKMPAKNIKLLVLDEADKLMDRNFFSQSNNKQVLAFSATYDKSLFKNLENFVHNPYYIMLSDDSPGLEEINTLVDKYLFYEEKFKKMAELLSKVPFYQCIVFLNHRGRAVDLANYLTNQGWMSMNISGGLDQKQRLDTMSKARKFEIRVLVCSDLIARGIDIERVNLVINLDMPKDPETYLHRVGRTGRYGTHGLAISFVDQNEMKFIELLKENYNIDVQPLSNELSIKHHQRPLTTETDQKAYEEFLNKRETIKTQISEIPPVEFSKDYDNQHKEKSIKKSDINQQPDTN